MNGNHRFVPLIFFLFFVFLSTCTTGLISKGLKKLKLSGDTLLMKCFNYSHGQKSWDSCTVLSPFNTRQINIRARLTMLLPTPSPRPPDSVETLKRQFLWSSNIVLDGDWGGGWRSFKRQHGFSKRYLWFTESFCYALKAFFPESRRHYETFKMLSTAMLPTPEKRLGYVKLYKINTDNWMILLTNHSQLNKSRNIRKYKLTQKK